MFIVAFCTIHNTLLQSASHNSERSEKRAQLVALVTTGFSQRHIVRYIQSTASMAIRRLRESGTNVNQAHSGAPRVSTARDDAYLCRTAHRLRHVTARALPQENKRYALVCLHPIRSQNRVGIMFWDCIGYSGRGHLVEIDRTMN